MSETLEKTIPLVIATVVAWVCVAVIVLLNVHVLANGAALILGLFFTMVMWTMWALDQYGLDIDGNPREHEVEKPKRATEGEQDARVALLLSLLTPDERDALKSRLANDLRGDGEAVTLADLLEAQQRDSRQDHES